MSLLPDKDREEFFAKLKKEHFDNTTKIIVKQLDISSVFSKKKPVFVVKEHVNFTRLGNGMGEEGPGDYEYNGKGTLTIQNGKISKADYEFKKLMVN